MQTTKVGRKKKGKILDQIQHKAVKMLCTFGVVFKKWPNLQRIYGKEDHARQIAVVCNDASPH